MSNTAQLTVSNKRRTLIKDRIGHVRTTSYNLPPEEHVYGTLTAADKEGAGQVMSRWVEANLSKAKQTQRSFTKTNRLALQSGCLTAKAQREFAVAHPNIMEAKNPNHRGNKNSKPSIPFDGPFGVKTVSQAETVKDLIKARFTNFVGDDDDYPSHYQSETRKKLGKLPPPRPTKASIGHDMRFGHRGYTIEYDGFGEPIPPAGTREDKVQNFKMKKFTQVPPKISSYRSPQNKSPMGASSKAEEVDDAPVRFYDSTAGGEISEEELAEAKGE